MKVVLYCFACIFILSACQTPRVAERPTTLPQLFTTACRFGTVQTVDVTTGYQLGSGYCSETQAWNANDTVLILTYSDSTTFWRVTNQAQDRGRWVQQANLMAEGKTKAEVVSLYALPDCVGMDNAWWTNCSLPGCKCPCDVKQSPDSLIRYIEKIVLPPNTRMAFGVAGTNIWGPGGALQWNLLDTTVASFIVEKREWK